MTSFRTIRIFTAFAVLTLLIAIVVVTYSKHQTAYFLGIAAVVAFVVYETIHMHFFNHMSKAYRRSQLDLDWMRLEAAKAYQYTPAEKQLQGFNERLTREYPTFNY